MVSVGILAIPVKQTCGVAGYSCATAPDVYGNAQYYYEIQPLVAGAYEAISGANFPFSYSAGVDLVPLR